MTTPYIEEKVEFLAGEFNASEHGEEVIRTTLQEVDRRAREWEQKRTLKDAIEWKEKGFELDTFIDKLRTYPIADKLTNLTPNQ